MTTRHALAVLALASALAGPAAAADQAPAPKKVYTNRTAFKLPLRVDEKDRERLQSVELHVKTVPGGSWALQASVPPTQTEFVYKVPQDGEYWFTVITVDKTGGKNPADLSREPPSLVVIVDRAPPEADVHPTTSALGQALLQCEIRDAHPDPAKTKLEYQTPDGSWQALEPMPDQPTAFRVPDPGALRGVVRVTAVDLAGNITRREVNLVASAPPVTPDIPLPSAPVESRSEKPALSAVPPVGMPAPTAPAPATTAATAPRQIVNHTHVPVLYQIDHEGPSGISKVEVWMTRDDGQTWQRLVEDPNRHSPVEIDLPGDGVYGLTVVVTGGNGSGGTPPAQGEPPDFRVEVDTTKPEAQILAVRPGTGAEAGTFLITWTANDKNMKADGIDLDYAPHADGPWTPIAHGLHNDGNYRWSGPHDAAGEVHVRMRVSDAAGNMTTCMAPQPLIFDRSRPKAKVLGVLGNTGAAVTPEN